MSVTSTISIDTTAGTGNLTFTVNLTQIVEVNFTLLPVPQFDFSARGIVTIDLNEVKTVVKALVNFDKILFDQFQSMQGFATIKNKEFDLSFSKSITGNKNIHVKFKIINDELQDFKWKQVTNDVIFQPRNQITINLEEWKFFLNNFKNAIKEIDNF